MTNIHVTFEVEGRAIFAARESLAGSWTRFIDPKSDFRAFLSTLHDNEGSIAPIGATLSVRQSTPYEIEQFVTRSAETCRAGRTDWEDILDGYPIFLIDCVDPTFPDHDVNTGLPVP